MAEAIDPVRQLRMGVSFIRRSLFQISLDDLHIARDLLERQLRPVLRQFEQGELPPPVPPTTTVAATPQSSLHVSGPDPAPVHDSDGPHQRDALQLFVPEDCESNDVAYHEPAVTPTVSSPPGPVGFRQTSVRLRPGDLPDSANGETRDPSREDDQSWVSSERYASVFNDVLQEMNITWAPAGSDPVLHGPRVIMDWACATAVGESMLAIKQVLMLHRRSSGAEAAPGRASIRDIVQTLVNMETRTSRGHLLHRFYLWQLLRRREALLAESPRRTEQGRQADANRRITEELYGRPDRVDWVKKRMHEARRWMSLIEIYGKAVVFLLDPSKFSPPRTELARGLQKALECLHPQLQGLCEKAEVVWNVLEGDLWSQIVLEGLSDEEILTQGRQANTQGLTSWYPAFEIDTGSSPQNVD